ncbi:uncharacterized protein HKW66_Vig0090440 [Vigna angularis]|uniref:Putative plant transposon protein domain-containing protein n=1 Tax=Phaseolus angularis TaxID=3914 RepID=A0A8T0KKH5_PHAAN|nr:uncharacterized protein HKW66_Vig0090440 [Vigna angularis]
MEKWNQTTATEFCTLQKLAPGRPLQVAPRRDWLGQECGPCFDLQLSRARAPLAGRAWARLVRPEFANKMASVSGTKRIKTTATKRQKQKKNSKPQTFLSQRHKKNFEESQNRRLLMERVVEQLPREEPQFAQEVWRRHWSNLISFPEPANIDVVREFYANARSYLDEPQPFTSYVRGRPVAFDANTINSFLNTQWPGGNSTCHYSDANRTNFAGIDYEEVERTLCLPRGHFHRNRQGQPLHIKRSFLTPLSKYWMAFIHANISLCSHMSDLNVSRALLLFFILQGKPINVGNIIALLITALSNTPLGHPSLITHLCEIAGVDTSLPPFEKPRKTIDRSYYLQYCLIDEDGQNIPAPQPPRRHRRNQPDPPAQPEEDGPQNPFNMADLNAKLEALHRMGLAHADMMRQVYASSHPGFMTSEEYAARVAWPGDQTSTDGGAGTSSGAQAMEEDQSEEEDEEEQSEEEEEEEQSEEEEEVEDTESDS